jgi:hypothetical protein
MFTLSSTSPAPDRVAHTSPPGRRLPALLREPLLHFLVLGAVVFAADHFIAGRIEDPHTIVIDAKVDAEARQVFHAARGREPDAKELDALRRAYLDNETLYREGLAMGVDKGDQMIRERVIFKMLSVVDAGIRLPQPDDQTLRAWFEKNRIKYDEPMRYDFQEAVLFGDRSEPALRAFAAALNSGNPGDAKASLNVFKARPHENIVQGYGEEFAKALEESPRGEWRVLPTRDGLRLMRLDGISQPNAGDFERLRGVVLQDWKDQTMAQLRTDAVRAISNKYKIRVQDTSR